jgi:beta-phosphoglucomutase
MEKIKKFIKDNGIKGLLFDLNGTMVDDVGYHIIAWHKLINEMGRPMSIEETKPEIYGRNEELIERVFPGQFTEEERVQIGIEKEAKYREEFRPFLKLISGLEDFLSEMETEGILLSIGSAAIIPNIDYVLDSCDIRHYFPVIVSGEDVSNSKPDPEVFIKCADQLGLPYHKCLVFEDVPKGVEAAVRAGMKAVAVTSTHTVEEFASLEEHIVEYIADYR